jgi:hypothetical protein
MCAGYDTRSPGQLLYGLTCLGNQNAPDWAPKLSQRQRTKPKTWPGSKRCIAPRQATLREWAGTSGPSWSLTEKRSNDRH